MRTNKNYLIILVILCSEWLVYCDQTWNLNCRCNMPSANLTHCESWDCSKTFNYDDVSCFPGKSIVAVPSFNSTEQKNTYIKDLEIGTKVYSVNEKGEIIVDEIIGFLHLSKDKKGNFLKITYQILNSTSEREIFQTIFISEDHLILAKSGYLKAKELKINEEIYSKNPLSNILEKTLIVSIDKEEALGVYAPLTISGNLFIDGVLVSNYAHISDHYLAHSAFFPLRLLYKICPYSLKPLLSTSVGEVNWYAFILQKLNYIFGFV